MGEGAIGNLLFVRMRRGRGQREQGACAHVQGAGPAEGLFVWAAETVEPLLLYCSGSEFIGEWAAGGAGGVRGHRRGGHTGTRGRCSGGRGGESGR